MNIMYKIPALLIAIFLMVCTVGCSSYSSPSLQAPQSEASNSPDLIREDEKDAEASSSFGDDTVMPDTAPDEPLPIEGLIALTKILDGGKGNARIILSSIDPSTGKTQELRSFLISGYMDNYNNFAGHSDCSSVYDRLFFSSDYSKLVASKPMPDGSHHVGWIDTNGVFTDVTEAVTMSNSDFGGITRHYDPRFSGDYFYYGTLTGSPGSIQRAIRRVPVNNLSKDSDEEVYGDYGRSQYYIYPDGNVAAGKLGVRSDNPIYFDKNMDSYAEYGHFCDWISKEAYVGIDMEKSQLYIYDSKPGDGGNKPFLPSIDGRINYNAVVSPNGEEIAFLSCLTTSTDTSWYLFTVPTIGGDPVKIATTHEFRITGIGAVGVTYFSKLYAWE